MKNKKLLFPVDLINCWLANNELHSVSDDLLGFYALFLLTGSQTVTVSF